MNATSLDPKVSLAQRFSLFGGLSPMECATIISAARERSYSRKQVIFTEGDPVSQIMMLLSGCVKVSQIGVNGNEVILRLNGAGELLGAFGLCAHCSHCSTARAIQPCLTLAWQAAEFERLMDRFPVLRRNAVTMLEERLREMEGRFREVSTEKVRSRLSGELLRLCHRLQGQNGGAPEITLSRAELAQLTGTTLFTVSRLLCEWQSLGIVKIRREAVLVRDLTALTQLSETE